ncbi:MAG: MBOAT family protein [Rikenellaceae bacterium]|jgi:D-alanyl-lipoteichoic acid acyltransferase DltB (MBOAT superfamily)|nr:MBOAT family protein [Rikenellaceae bacterium]
MFETVTQNLLRILSYNPQEPLLFNSALFLFLYTGVLIVYGLLRKKGLARILFITAFSYYFYYKSSGLYFFILLFISLSDFAIGHAIARARTLTGKKALVALSLIVDLGILFYFKYTYFLFQTIADLVHKPFDPFDIILPVGISFFTFQSISYIIDIYRDRIAPLKSWFDYNFYLSFFPQLVAGPIVRARDFIPQIRQRPFVSKEMTGRAIFLIAGGLVKKAVISDYISVNFVDRIFDNPHLYSGIENLAGVYGYALQIYCDFSGYSDMAIGLALLMGFHFNINFDAPYKSATVTEFWRRWHISLSSWLKDYLYISLGGNRKGRVRTYLNLMTTMTLGGLWHGASVRFVLWGIIHGAALSVHKMVLTLFPRLTKKTGAEMKPWRRAVGIVLTFHLVCAAWVLFRADSMATAHAVFRQIFTAFHPELLRGMVTGYGWVFILMAVGYIAHFLPARTDNALRRGVTRLGIVGQAALLVVVIWIVIQFKSSEVVPFIYFQF